MRKSVLFKLILLVQLLLTLSGAMAQCPANIGFEDGSFTNWQISVGRISQIDGSIASKVVDSFYRVNMIKNKYPQDLDPYGYFPVNCPNGSNYSIKLGDTIGYGLAQTVSYTFTIPPDQDNYSIIYNYAVVLQEPGHQSWQQPSFTSKVFDVSSNSYIECGAFTFVASANLPGFEKSVNGQDVYYKPWAPISIKLAGHAGKTLRLEFTTHDCSFGPHFGYAYIDVNENCTTSIQGNVFCNSSSGVNLTAPPGFSSYKWFDNSYSNLLDSSNILKLSPLPALGSMYHVVIKPYPGLGCLDTLHTSIQLSDHVFKLKTVDSIVSCRSDLVDLTAPFVTAGSLGDLQFSYFRNSALTDYEPTPKHVKDSGVYYIKAENSIGCTDTKPVSVMIHENPLFSTINQISCGWANILAPVGFISDQANLINSYWMDSTVSVPIARPDSITNSGIYYIKATNGFGCSTIEPIQTKVFPKPYFSIAPAPLLYYPTTLDLTALVKQISNTPAVISYWQDAAATLALSNPRQIYTGGTYYIQSTSSDGCVVTDSITILVKVVPINPPNAFSPNQDGINDTWHITDLQNFPDCTVDVFNRYGQIVYRSKGYNNNWDGTFNNQLLPIGTYYYIIKASPIAQPISGSVSIIR